MSSAMNHRKRSHRSQYRARPFEYGRVRISITSPALHKRSTFDLIRLIKEHRRKQPQTQSGRVVVGEPVYSGGGGGE